MLDNVCSARAYEHYMPVICMSVWVWVCAYLCVCCVHVPASFVHLSSPELCSICLLPLKVLLRQPKLLLTRLLRRNHISATFWQPLFFTYSHTHKHVSKTACICLGVSVCYTCLTWARCPWCSVSACFLLRFSSCFAIFEIPWPNYA